MVYKYMEYVSIVILFESKALPQSKFGTQYALLRLELRKNGSRVREFI